MGWMDKWMGSQWSKAIIGEMDSCLYVPVKRHGPTKPPHTMYCTNATKWRFMNYCFNVNRLYSCQLP